MNNTIGAERAAQVLTMTEQEVLSRFFCIANPQILEQMLHTRPGTTCDVYIRYYDLAIDGRVIILEETLCELIKGHLEAQGWALEAVIPRHSRGRPLILKGLTRPPRKSIPIPNVSSLSPEDL